MQELMKKIFMSDPEPLTANEVPPELRELIYRCLAKDYDKRPNAQECVRVLQQIHEQRSSLKSTIINRGGLPKKAKIKS